jgi:8-oxo-dGTP diphosphatase
LGETVHKHHPPRVLHVSTALLIHDGQLLLARRNPDDSYGGLWELPGGKIEKGESIEESMVRELDEELELQVELSDLIPFENSVFHRPGMVLHLYAFIVQLSQKVHFSNDHDQIQWLDQKSLKAVLESESLPLSVPDIPLLEKSLSLDFNNPLI